MAKRIVLFDAYNWMTPLEGQPGRFQHNTAARGDEIDVSDDEVKRGEALGALGTQEDLDRQNAAASAGAPGVVSVFTQATDQQINSWSVEQVHAYLNQVPEAQRAAETERVVALEELRNSPRSGVLSLAGVDDES